MPEYIERDSLQAALKRKQCGPANKRYTEGWNDCLMRVKSMVSTAPAADVAPVVHGRWERDAEGDWYCTNCNEVVAICDSGRERTYRKPYCPNCGAKMDGGADHE